MYHLFIIVVNRSLIGEFYVTHASRPYRATICRQRELTLGHTHTFWPYKDTESLPEWGINSMPGHIRDNKNIKYDTHHSLTHSF